MCVCECLSVCECANKLNAIFIASSGLKSVQQKPNCSCSFTERQQKIRNVLAFYVVCRPCNWWLLHGACSMKQKVLWAVHLPLCCVCLGHLVAATGGTYTIKVHIKFHSVSGFDRRSRRRRRQRRLRGCVAIETAEAILHFVAHFMGSHCVANAKAIVVLLVASVVLVLVCGVVVVVVGKAYLPFS